MNKEEQAAHSLVLALSNVVRILMAGIEFGEGGLRTAMQDIGLSVDNQTLLLLFLLSSALVGTIRLVTGRIRIGIALVLILILVHILEKMGHSLGP
jgi:hypothetical protein